MAVENDADTIDPQIQMSLGGKKEFSVIKSLEQLSLAISYKQIQLGEQTKQADQLVIELPSGVTYSDGKAESVSFDEASREMVIDLAKTPVQSIALDLNFDQLADQTVLQGTHYLNNQAVGTSEELTLSKELSSESVEANTAEPQEIIAAEGTEAAEFGTTPAPRANLDLGIATSRQLPVQAVTDGQFGNVSYFDVGTYDEWAAALSTANNNKQEITYINLIGSFALDTGTHFENVDASSRSYSTNKTGKKLIVNGNGQTIDNRGRRMEFDGRAWDVVFQDLKIQSANAWGSIDGYNSRARGTYTFHDVDQYGHQFYEGSRGRVILSGNTSAVMAPEMKYSSNIDGQDIYINTGYGAGNGNINAGEIYIKADAQVLLKNSHLGADLLVFKDGNIYFEEGGHTSLTLDNTEKNTKWSKWGGVGDYTVGAMSITDRVVSGEQWSAAEIPSGSSLAGLKNSIHLAENTQLTIRNGEQRKDFAAAVQIFDSSGTFRVGKNATVDILVEEDSSNDSSSQWSTRGNSQVPVFLSKGARFEIAENAKFNIEVGKSITTGNPVSSLGPVIRAGSGTAAKLDLTIGEGAQFEVKAANDSSLIQDNSNGGSIMVADQATLDLGFTVASSKGLIDLKAGTVNIPASGEYIHRIQQWAYGSYDEAAPTEAYHPIDGTKISYSGTSITNRTTNLATGFADSSPSIKEKFENNFTSNAQRVVVDPVVFNVKTLDELTNETKAEYSVKGTAEPPGGKIELSGGPLDQLPVADRQLLVQTDGSYEWKGTLSRPFYWGETIRASYVGHSDKYAETVVKDVTKPTGIGRTIHLVEGETIPLDKAFIASVEDTNALETNKDAFDYSFLGSAINSGGAATITNGQESQEFLDQVIIDDTRGNHSDPVEVRLIVHKANTINSIMAQDLIVRWSDVSSYTVGAIDYQAYLKNGMQAKAQTIIDGNLIDLSSSIQIDNISSIPNTVGGTYTVRFIVIADEANKLGADLVKEVQLTILPNLTDPRDPSTPDPTENENEGTGEHGGLRLDYVPSRFDLGSKELQWKDMEYQAIGTSDQWIQIADERPAATGWTLKAAATPFDSGTDQLIGASLIIPKGDMYNKKTAGAANSSGLVSKGDVPLTTTASALFTGDGVNSKNESTYVWKKNQVKLKVPKSQGKVGQTYRSTITWTVEAGATN